MAIVKTSNEMTKLLRLEHDRTRLQMEIDTYNKENGASIEIRELASKGFDNTTNVHDGICYDNTPHVQKAK